MRTMTMNRFHIFLIDTGWSTAVSKRCVAVSHLPVVIQISEPNLPAHARAVG